MEQMYYEKDDNFRPVYNTAIALLQARKLDEIPLLSKYSEKYPGN